MSIEKGLQDQIKKHLPEMAAKEMAEYIKVSEQTKIDLALVEAKLITAEKRIADAAVKCADLTDSNLKLLNDAIAVKNQKETNDKMLLQIEKRERDLELILLRSELGASQRYNNDMLNLMTVAFKNPVVKETVHRVDPVTRHVMNTKYNSQTGNYEDYSVANTMDEERIETTKKEIE